MKWLLNSERAPSREHVAAAPGCVRKLKAAVVGKGGYHLAGRTAMNSDVRSIRSG
jgi:hypothetical protein